MKKMFLIFLFFSNILVAQKPVNRIAVLNFSNYATYKFDRFIDGLPELLSQELVSFPEIIVVERAQIDQVLNELRMQSRKEFDPNTAAKIGKLLGVQSIILGGLYEIGGNIKLSTRIVDVETAKIEKGDFIEGREEDLFSMVKNLALQIRYFWSGSIYFEGYPENCSVYLNDSLIGNTPIFISGLNGLYSIRIEKYGFQTFSENKAIYAGNKDRVSFSLTPTSSTRDIWARNKYDEAMKEHNKSLVKAISITVTSLALILFLKNGWVNLLAYPCLAVGVGVLISDLITWPKKSKFYASIIPKYQGIALSLNFKIN